MTISLLNKENTGLIIVDVQEKLMQVMGNPDRVTDRIVKLLHLFAGLQSAGYFDRAIFQMVRPQVPPTKGIIT